METTKYLSTRRRIKYRGAEFKVGDLVTDRHTGAGKGVITGIADKDDIEVYWGRRLRSPPKASEYYTLRGAGDLRKINRKEA